MISNNYIRFHLFKFKPILKRLKMRELRKWLSFIFVHLNKFWLFI